MRKHIAGIVALVLVAVVFVAAMMYYKTTPNGKKENPKGFVALSDPMNATYKISGKLFTLSNGVSNVRAAGDKSTTTTLFFGYDAHTDLNGDGKDDSVSMITQSTGGSGTFFYVVALLSTKDGYVGSDAMLLGDRIAPQNIEIEKNSVVLVNYADRKPGESFTTQPSMGKSVWLKFDPVTMQFGEIVQNFEGEANPSMMSLPMKEWKWIRTLYNNGSRAIPRKVDSFKITFSKDGKFSATTDCNTVVGTYSTNKEKISFGQMASTKMFCANSQEDAFIKTLAESQSYHFTSFGELVLGLKMDSGSVIFK